MSKKLKNDKKQNKKIFSEIQNLHNSEKQNRRVQIANIDLTEVKRKLPNMRFGSVNQDKKKSKRYENLDSYHEEGQLFGEFFDQETELIDPFGIYDNSYQDSEKNNKAIEK